MTPRQETLLTSVLLAFCVGLVVWNLAPRLMVQRVEIVEEEPDVTVSIAGAVYSPGVYTLPWGSRVSDLITAAGGLTPDAEATLVNPADPLDTGESVMVPLARTESGDVRISLNSATLKELDTLPRIGPALAERIIAARPFSSVDDLLEVSGIGPATLEGLRPLVKP